MKKIIPFLLILCLLLAVCFGSCGGKDKDNSSGSQGSQAQGGNQTEEALTLYPAFLEVPLGQHVTLEAKAKGNKAVTWSSSNPSVATVDENGRVEPLSEGETIITVALAEDAGTTAACGVLVTEEGNIFVW